MRTAADEHSKALADTSQRVEAVTKSPPKRAPVVVLRWAGSTLVREVYEGG